MNQGLSETCSTAKPQPVLERLKQQKLQTMERLENIETAIKNLEKNPNILETLEALNKLGHY